MSNELRIALVGDYDGTVTAHRAIPLALKCAAELLGVEASGEWISTASIGATASEISSHSAIWCVPGSPYKNTAGALAAIRFGRERRRPFLGTCGGFQHAVLEFSRNVLGHSEAEHAEIAPEASMPIVSRLTCSLVEKTGRIVLRDGSRLREIYGRSEAQEAYHCNFGVNPAYAGLFDDPCPLRVAALDEAGEIRAVELREHPFFVATLFQPERSALRGVAHPLIAAFLAAAVQSDRPAVDRV